jgi:hypothetical protein
MSKVMEIIVKSDLETHLAAVNGQPSSQHGFRPKRLCGSALAYALACWSKGVEAGKVVAVMAMDLSAAFDTIGNPQLLPKLEALGVSKTALRWFESYMRGGT